jgi:RNA polymerase sigma-70 factor (sigma-E family)
VAVSGSGERDALFTAFVAARYPGLVRSAYLLTGDRGAAEDLVQAALLRTYGRWSRLGAPQNAEAFTRTVMVHLAARGRDRRWNAEMPVETVPEIPIGDGSAYVDERQRVQSALALLPWPQRAVLVLRFFDDRSEAETAELLGCSVGTVKSRTSRALASLRAAGLLSTQSQQSGEVGHGR